MSSRVTLVTVTLVAALIGLNLTVLKYALDHSSPILLTAFRSSIAGPLLLAVALARGESLPRRLADWGNIFVVALSVTTLSSALLVAGTDRVPAGLASLLSSTMPLFTGVLMVTLIRVRISARTVGGLVVGFGGTATLATASMEGRSQTIGIVLLVLSAMAWAYGTVHMKWRDMTRMSPLMLVAIQLLFSAAVLVPFGLAVEGTDRIDPGWDLYLPLLYAAIPAQALTFLLLATVVRHASPTHAAAAAYLVPLFGVFFGWLIRGERMGSAELAGGALIVAGVYIVATAAVSGRASAATADEGRPVVPPSEGVSAR